ncbi:MAG: site-specific integrase [Thermoanaerobaculia bacterium]|nr:site-specific integrase [Thermoanaerobaculia bacterium]
MKVRINKTTIDEAVYEGPGGCYLWDTGTSGFGVRIYPSGRKTFVITYRTKSQQHFVTIGRYGEMTVQQARAEALELLGRARKGEDLGGGRRAAKGAPTVADLAQRHLQDHAAIKKTDRSAKRDRQAWERCVLPQLGKRKVADITRADISKLITGMAETPAMANKVFSLLSKAFALAEVWGWRPENSNPCRNIGRYHEEARERYLSESELARLGEVLVEAEESWGTSPQAVAAVRLLILTGCRSSEILKLRWEDIDFERRCLHLPEGKTGKRTVLLNAGALQILEGLERIEGNPYVIPGNRPGSHFATLQRFWDRVRVVADIKDVRVHDIRHHFASVGINTGQNLSVIGKLLGHTKITTTQRYAHLADDPLRKANEEIGATLAATLDRKKSIVTNIEP